MQSIKTNYYWFNREKILTNKRDKYHNKGGEKKAAKYYIPNKTFLREDARNKYRNLSEKEKERKTKYQRDKYHMDIDLNEKLKTLSQKLLCFKEDKKFFFLHNVNISRKTLKFGNVVVNKKEFHTSKKTIH